MEAPSSWERPLSLSPQIGRLKPELAHAPFGGLARRCLSRSPIVIRPFGSLSVRMFLVPSCGGLVLTRPDVRGLSRLRMKFVCVLSIHVG